MITHVKVLGVLNLVCGAFMLIGAMLLALVLGGTAGIVGAAADAEDAAIAIPILGIAGSALSIWQLIDGTRDRASLGAAIAAEYQIAEAQLAGEIDAFVAELKAAKLVEGG